MINADAPFSASAFNNNSDNDVLPRWVPSRFTSEDAQQQQKTSTDRFDRLVYEHFKSMKWLLGVAQLTEMALKLSNALAMMAANSSRTVSRQSDRLRNHCDKFHRPNRHRISLAHLSPFQHPRKTVEIYTPDDQSRNLELIADNNNSDNDVLPRWVSSRFTSEDAQQQQKPAPTALEQQQKPWSRFPHWNLNPEWAERMRGGKQQLRLYSPMDQWEQMKANFHRPTVIEFEFPAENNAGASALGKWLITPRRDGLPKMLQCNLYLDEMEGLKRAFVNASEPANFIIRTNLAAFNNNSDNDVLPRWVPSRFTSEDAQQQQKTSTDRFDRLVDEHFKSMKWLLGVAQLTEMALKLSNALAMMAANSSRTVSRQTDNNNSDNDVLPRWVSSRFTSEDAQQQQKPAPTALEQQQKPWSRFPHWNLNPEWAERMRGGKQQLRLYSPMDQWEQMKANFHRPTVIEFEFPAENNAGASALGKWLITPRRDGLPKMLQCNLYLDEMEGLKRAFVNASEPANFIIRTKVYTFNQPKPTHARQPRQTIFLQQPAFNNNSDNDVLPRWVPSRFTSEDAQQQQKTSTDRFDRLVDEHFKSMKWLLGVAQLTEMALKLSNALAMMAANSSRTVSRQTDNNNSDNDVLPRWVSSRFTSEEAQQQQKPAPTALEQQQKPWSRFPHWNLNPEWAERMRAANSNSGCTHRWTNGSR
uniref:Uncharacterized protein n=1 Tax=Globodera rostochiensis TaxID=31243 RepID=A0A914IFN1_GLORO